MMVPTLVIAATMSHKACDRLTKYAADQPEHRMLSLLIELSRPHVSIRNAGARGPVGTHCISHQMSLPSERCRCERANVLWTAKSKHSLVVRSNSALVLGCGKCEQKRRLFATGTLIPIRTDCTLT